jgi:very-short-patch-repair endonuclease
MIDKKILYSRAKLLRENMTEAECILWQLLRARHFVKLKFRRQAVIGNYIVDFVCYRKKLVIELDGRPHLKREKYDKKRTQYLESKGFRVIRFWNSDILLHTELVLEQVLQACLEFNPPPQSSPQNWGRRRRRQALLGYLLSH